MIRCCVPKRTTSSRTQIDKFFSRFSHAIARATGKPITFVVALAGIVLWAVSGPVFGFSDTWQLIVNTSTTIVTFLMVFVLQSTQNRDGEALQAKLDELILVTKGENSLIEAEKLDEHELRQLRDTTRRAAIDEGSRSVTGT